MSCLSMHAKALCDNLAKDIFCEGINWTFYASDYQCVTDWLFYVIAVLVLELLMSQVLVKNHLRFG